MTHLCVMCAIGSVILFSSAAPAQRFVEVAITGGDYAFINPAPALAPGPTTFSFENKGKVPHEMILVRLRPGVTVDSALRARLAGAPPQETSEAPIGILIANPGDRTPGRLLVDLVAERTYLLVCNFRDAPDKPRHITLGMVASFQVR